jgi:hypothetical protein
MAICDSLSQQASPNAHAPHSGKGCSADNYRVFVSMYCYVSFRTSHPKSKQLPHTVDNGFVMFQSPCR